MNRKDIIPIVVILILILLYPTLDRKFVAKWFPKSEPVAAAQATPPPAAPVSPAPVAAAPEATPATATLEEPAEPEAPRPDPVDVVLENGVARYVLSTRGAAVVRAEMLAKRNDGTWLYPLSEKAKDSPVAFDFSDRPAAAFAAGPFSADTDFELVGTPTATSAVFRARSSAAGVAVERRVSLDDAYSLGFDDSIVPLAGSQRAAPLALALQTGWMGNLEGEAFDPRLPLLGVDTLQGSSVEFWGRKLESWFKQNKSPGVVQSHSVAVEDDDHDSSWVAAKNKYFVQIIRPAEEVTGKVTLHARRGQPVDTRSFIFFKSQAYPFEAVSATIALPSVSAAEGAARLSSKVYIGPKDYEVLKAAGYHQEDVLELGFWRVIGIWILKLMVWFRNAIWPHNYGLSIILLTLLLRVVFWPLNHKSLASTRRMQEIQPLIAEIREKYKKDPQRLQMETMRVYKENKINPLGGCLPMLIQIPVFFALFVVLRGAIELRFSSFLWIRDLSAPENLLADKLPFAINILPIFMGVTMWLQQKMTPTSDPQQQKMMALMPILFTLLFYSFPSGLSLYWSANQVMMIVQLAIMRRKSGGTSPASAPAAPPRR